MPPASGGVDVGEVMSSSIALLKANLPLLVMVNAACAIPGWLISTGGSLYQAASGVPVGASPADFGGMFIFVVIGLVGGLVSFVMSTIAVSASTRIGLDGVDGHTEIDFQGALSYGLAHALPTLGILFLVGLAVGFGTILCLVPGIIAACALAVSLPASIAESKGVMESLQRSVDLTDGHRMNIFLIYVLMALAVIGVILPFSCCVGAAAGGAAATGGGVGMVATLVQQVVTLVVTIVIGAFQQMVGVSIYARLTGYGARTDGAAVAQVFR